MDDKPLKHGDAGPDVAVAQDLLNRNGALLQTDGQFGSGTETAVREAQAHASLPDDGEIGSVTWALLRRLPEPCPEIGTRATTFIAQQEVSSRAYYDAVEARPSYPGLASGITIGVGYDLRFEDTFATDWRDVLPPATLAALSPFCGQQGSSRAVAQLAGIRILWSAAWTVFLRRSLPSYLAKTRAAFPEFDTLAPLCRGALVSLVFNRGADMAGDDRTEMRDMRDALDAGRFGALPGLLRQMKRLWPHTSGLRDRRDQEAALFEEGLATM